jgi:UDP-N-acetylmuramoylalanine--D-glutamate ligase
MAEFILKEGGILTITDLRKEEVLSEEIEYLKKWAKENDFLEKINFSLGGHEQKLFEGVDEVVFNPAVPYNSTWPQFCLKNEIKFYNDFTLFQEYFFQKYQNKENKPKQIWITGTRGKTTTTNFIKDLLGDEAVLGGNQPGNSLQKISYDEPEFFVLETSNHQLEYPIENKSILEPNVCVLTNIYVDHVGRHGSFEEYKKVKHKIFEYNPNANLFLLSGEESVKDISDNNLHNKISFVLPGKEENLSKNQNIAFGFAEAVAKYLGVSEDAIMERKQHLTFPKMRQEIVGKVGNITFINDSAATSPDALISSIKDYGEAIFISGGTDASLDFTDLVNLIREKKLLENKRIKFLKGTATDAILQKLGIQNFDSLVYDNFETCLRDILEEQKENKNSFEVILSPGAKSFGLFLNEFDRGEKFNLAVKNI